MDGKNEEVTAALKEFSKDVPGNHKYYASGKLIDVAKIDFETSDAMWSFLKANKGHKFSFKGKQLWHRVHQTESERMIGKRTSKAVNLLRLHVKNQFSVDEDRASELIDGDRDRGLVFYQPSTGPVVRLYDRKKDAMELHVHENASSSGLDFDFKAHLTDINEIS